MSLHQIKDHATLHEGSSLISNGVTIGERMLSSNGLTDQTIPFRTVDWMNAILQEDGNFVVYYAQLKVRATSPDGYAKWASGTPFGPQAGPFRLTNHKDGNLVLYNGAGTEIWRAPHNKAVKKLPCKLIMQDDGNLVYYDAAGVAVWATDTNGQTHP